MVVAGSPDSISKGMILAAAPPKAADSSLERVLSPAAGASDKGQYSACIAAATAAESARHVAAQAGAD